MREAVGIWDESPLQKWRFRGPDALAAADYCFANNMASLEVGQCRYGAFSTSAARCSATASCSTPASTRTACWS